MRKLPVTLIDSADKALRLAVLLSQEGPMRVTDVAARLEVAQSTAHRLLAVLVHRDFAEQLPDRRYCAGPVLRRPATPEPMALLRSAALPHLRALAESSGETAQLTTRVGVWVRFVATVECRQVLRVGDREGRTLPAHLASGGLAMLAALPPIEVTALYERFAREKGAVGHGESPPDPVALTHLLRRVRRNGFAINDQATEAGVTAIGRYVSTSRVAAAVSLAMPSSRFAPGRMAGWLEQLAEAAIRIERDLLDPG